jgi:hypothetical protein
MRILAFVLALLCALPAAAQQRQQARPAQQPVSGWTVPIQNFAASYNATAARLTVDERAVMTECEDRGTPVRVCSFRIGPSVLVQAAAAADRQALRDLSLVIDGGEGALAIARLMAAFTTLTHHLDPGVAIGERGAALSALFDISTLQSRPNTVTLGTTKFSLTLIPGMRVLILTAERAG